MFSKIWWGLVAITLLGLLWFSVPYIGSAYYLDKGVQSLNEADGQAAAGYVETALRFEPNNALAHRWLAKAYLQLDKPEKALAAAQQALQLAPNNPLVQLEMGDVYHHLGEAEQAIAYYEAGLVGDRRPQLTADYLQLADQLWASGDQEGAIAIWQDKVRGTGYGDLYANWRLTQYYAGDEEAVALYQPEVSYFPLESVTPPPDHRLEKYQRQAVLGAVTDNLWDQETLLNVVAYRVWQDQSQATEELLQALVTENPDDANLRFYLGEMYHRRGDWAEAEAAYRQILEIDSNYAQAYLRLGMAAEERQSLQEEAAWYEQYYRMAPDDLLGIKKLAETYEVLDDPRAVSLRQDLTAKTDDRQLVAEIFNMAVEDVRLGPNLLSNANFEIWNQKRPQDWLVSNTSFNPEFNNAVFTGGADTLLAWNNTSARSSGVWVQNLPNKRPVFYGYQQHNLPLEAATYYLISFYFRTANVLNKNTARSSLAPMTPAPFKAASWLPPTDTRWRKYVMLVKNEQPKPLMVRKLAFLYGPGSLWLDNIEVKSVMLRQDDPDLTNELITEPVIVIQ